MSKGYGGKTDKVKNAVKKPTGEKSGTHAFSQKGKPSEPNWKNPNGRK